MLGGGRGSDTLDGGSGIDTASWALAGTGVTIVAFDANGDGAAQVGSDTDTLFGIENLVGTGFTDHLNGNAGANKLVGLGGNDFP